LSNTQTGGAEIITAAPFESVKAALSLFGEIGDRKSQQQMHQTEAPATLEVSSFTENSPWFAMVSFSLNTV
jgi:hypothetical protein